MAKRGGFPGGMPGNMTNLIPYRDNVALNLITSVLVIVGGIGFPVILDLGRQRNFRRADTFTQKWCW